MEKIVIIGSSGAGKTMLARALSSVLKMKVYHLDRFFWQSGWKRETRDKRINILQKLVQEKQWIIEGTYIHTSSLHLKAADTIIFLDVPPLLCVQRIMKRHYEHHGRPRGDIPVGSTDKLTLFRLLKVLAFPFQDGKTLKQTLRSYNPSNKQIIWLRSSKEVEDFLAQLEQHVTSTRAIMSA